MTPAAIAACFAINVLEDKDNQLLLLKRSPTAKLGAGLWGFPAGHIEEGEGTPASDRFDGILVACGRRPNGHAIGAEHADIHVNKAGFIPVDGQQRTNIPNIFAIGNIGSFQGGRHTRL